MNRQMPHVICDIDGTPVTPEQAKQIITQHFTVPDEVRRRRRGPPSPPQQQDTRSETPTGPDSELGEGPSASRARRHDSHTNLEGRGQTRRPSPPMILRG